MVTEKRGIPPSQWGPCGWALIHYVAMGYPETPTTAQRQQYAAFFNSLKDVLPCKMCRDNFRRHMTHASPDAALAQGRDALFEWTVRLHNIVNGETGNRRIDVRAAKVLYSRGMHCSCSPAGSRGLDVASCILFLAVVVVAAAFFSAPAPGRLR